MKTLTHLEMVKAALEAFRDPCDTKPQLIRSYNTLSELGGRHPGIILLQSLLSSEEYNTLAKRLRILTGNQEAVLPSYLDPYASLVDGEVPLSTVYEQLEIVLEPERWKKLLRRLKVYNGKRVGLTVLVKGGTEKKIGILDILKNGCALDNGDSGVWPLAIIDDVELVAD